MFSIFYKDEYSENIMYKYHFLSRLEKIKLLLQKYQNRFGMKYLDFESTNKYLIKRYLNYVIKKCCVMIEKYTSDSSTCMGKTL